MAVVWAECAAVSAELKELAPYLLDGKRTKLTQDGDVTAAIWVHGKEALVVVANLSETAAKPVAVALPKSLGGEMKPAFKDRPSGLKFAEGKLGGEVGKAEVHIYRIRAL